jgi:hypothetical protein
MTYDECAERRSDEPLLDPSRLPADGLADEVAKKAPDDSKHYEGGQNETARIFGPAKRRARSGNQATR